MTNKKNSTTRLSIFALREELRQEAADLSVRLARSVGRATSVELAPCLEYPAEVRAQRQLIDRLLYVQSCRTALERAVDRGGARLTWRWEDGSSTAVTFKRENNQMTMQAVRRQRAAG